MCGLLAGVGKILDEHILCELGIFNSGRGTDSSGIGWRNIDGSMETAKSLYHPVVAFTRDLAVAMRPHLITGAMIGHTRAATHGAITLDNAHPFVADGYVWAHNGIIANAVNFGKYAVDSQSLIHGIKAQSFARYEGSLAVIWISPDGRLNAYRHASPLYRGKYGGAAYLASAAEYLEAVGCESVKMLSEHHLYSWDRYGLLTAKKIPSPAADDVSPLSDTWYDESAWYKKFKDRTNSTGYCTACYETLPWGSQAVLCPSCEKTLTLTDVPSNYDTNDDNDAYERRKG